MTAAPPVDCAACGRRIGKTRGHVLIGTLDTVSLDRVLCARCALDDSRRLHSRYWPHCPQAWHDLYDHPTGSATRAGLARVLDGTLRSP